MAYETVTIKLDGLGKIKLKSFIIRAKGSFFGLYSGFVAQNPSRKMSRPADSNCKGVINVREYSCNRIRAVIWLP